MIKEVGRSKKWDDQRSKKCDDQRSKKCDDQRSVMIKEVG